MQVTIPNAAITERFLNIRQYTERICAGLEPEDVAVQPIDFVSPPKWHLAHTTWFFEEFVLTKSGRPYKRFNNDYAYYFNSYYNNVGTRVIRANRGLMTRPTLKNVLEYRAYINEHMQALLNASMATELLDTIEIGLQHEQQHQELLIYDIKYILGHQAAFPSLNLKIKLNPQEAQTTFVEIDEGLYNIGYNVGGFCWDNELGRHKVYLEGFKISNKCVTNREYIAFIESGGYKNFNLWHADGWDWINQNNIEAPMYWHKVDGEWMYYTLHGFKHVDLELPVNHISFYEAFAFAEWKGMRLPTEFEWEVASNELDVGQLWEWTNSAYLPYPKFAKAEGAIGEYNGKFMINTMVMRGASVATPKGHSRPTYRNFFGPDSRWQFSGIRLAK